MFLNLKSVFGQGKNWIIHTVNTRLFGKWCNKLVIHFMILCESAADAWPIVNIESSSDTLIFFNNGLISEAIASLWKSVFNALRNSLFTNTLSDWILAFGLVDAETIFCRKIIDQQANGIANSWGFCTNDVRAWYKSVVFFSTWWDSNFLSFLKCFSHLSSICFRRQKHHFANQSLMS